MADPAFLADFDTILREYAGVPSPLYDATRLSEQVGGRILLKREDLNHTGAHKIRNVLGQALLTRRMGKTRVIAETGAGQHGVASATAAAYFGLDCTVYMGSVDTKRQALNVARMQLLGAKVVPVDSGSAHPQGRHQRGAARLGRHASTTRPTSSAPPPARTRSRAWSATSPAASATRRGPSASSSTARCRTPSPPASAAAPTRSGCSRVPRRRRASRSTASRPAATGVETGRHAATIHAGDVGVLHGARTFVLQDEDGQTIESHSISAGLDYPGVGPQHAHLAATGRATYRRSPTPRRWTRWRCSAAPRASSRRSSRRTPSPARCEVAKRLAADRARRDHADQPLAAAATRTWSTAIEWFDLGDADDGDRSRRMSVATRLREGPRRRPRRPGRLPAGRLPRRRRRHRRRCGRWSTPAAT